MKWSYALHMLCDDCKQEYDLKEPLNTCTNCGGLLEVQYDLKKMKKEVTPQHFLHREETMWKWHEFYPLQNPASVTSLGEGGTPMVKSVYAGPTLGLSNLFFKNDTLMPTGSFKDRGFSLAVSFAKELGLTKGVTYSSGNAGASFSAYANRAGINATILVEYLANTTKKSIIELYGGKVAILDFKSKLDVVNMLEEAASQLDIYQFVNFINPIRHEAMKSYAYEVCEFFSFISPDIMVHPVGTGGGIWGAWKGFCELRELDWIDSVPKMIAVQPTATASIVQAFQKGAKSAGKSGKPSDTIAQSIASDSPIQGGRRVLNAVNDSGGSAVEVKDDEILEAMKWLGKEGISAEPAAAASLAAVKNGSLKGKIKSDDRIVCVLTGSGLKQSSAIHQAVNESSLRINANLQELSDLLLGD